MNRKHIVGGLFVMLLIAASSYPALTTWSANAAPGPAPASVVDLQAPPGEDATCTAMPEAEEAACSRCPDGSPQCWGDKQCDSVCGGKGTGVCERINSCYRCCLCAL